MIFKENSIRTGVQCYDRWATGDILLDYSNTNGRFHIDTVSDQQINDSHTSTIDKKKFLFSIVHLTARGRPLEVPEIDSTGEKLIPNGESNLHVDENVEKPKI